MNQMIVCFVIFLAMIFSFVWGKISMGMTALIGMLLLVLSGCIDGPTALAGFGNESTIMLATMFIISAGFSKTQLVPKLSHLVQKVSGGSFVKILAGYVLITALLAQIVQSAMAVFSIVFPLVCAVCDDLKISRSKVFFSIGVTSISTISVLPIGNAAVWYAQYNGNLETYQYTDYLYNIWDPMLARLPMLIFVVAYMIFIAPKFAPEKPSGQLKNVEQAMTSAREPLSPLRETIGRAVFVLVILGLLTAKLHGIPTWEITLAGVLLLVLGKVLSAKEAYEAATMGGIVMLYVGVLAMGNALTATGAGQLIGNQITTLLGGTTNGYLIGFVFFIIPFLLTQVMVNNAVANIFVPIAILTCQSLGCNPLGPIMLVLSGALSSFMTPMATVAASMMMGLGGYDQRTMFKMSWLPALLLCIINVVWIMTIFPAFP